MQTDSTLQPKADYARRWSGTQSKPACVLLFIAVAMRDAMRLLRMLALRPAPHSHKEPTMKRTVWKIDRGFPSREIVRAERYVMVRRKGSIPYVIPETEWNALPLAPEPVEHNRRHDDERA